MTPGYISELAPILLLFGFMAALVLLGASGLLLLRAGAVHNEPGNTAPDGDRKPQNAAGFASSAGRSPLQRQLFQAGFGHSRAESHFNSIKFGLALAGVVIGLMMITAVPTLAGIDGSIRLILVIILGVFGYFLPVYLVEKRSKAWRKRIELAVPDALDFMLVCVEAGQSIDLAATKVAAELELVHPELAARFQDLTKELAAGGNRQEAFNHLVTQCESDSLRQFSVIVLQSSTLGTPVAQTLRVFSADLRDQRIRKIEEKAAVLPTKMTLGTMIFTVPPLLILLMAPAVHRIILSI